MSAGTVQAHVLIVEDLPDTQRWLADIVAQAFPGTTVQLAGSVAAARALLPTRQWALALIDLGLPDGSGIDLISQINETLPHLPAIVTTIYDDDDNLFSALAAGASGYLLKSQAAPALARQLRQQQQGYPPMSPSIARRLLTHFRQQAALGETTLGDAASPPLQLTAREQDVLRCIGHGMRTQEAAAELGLTEHTVTTYIRNLYEKLNISSRAEAALEAARRGLLPT
jgi:DNA-binding NarL/FixJ family response regulator